MPVPDHEEFSTDKEIFFRGIRRTKKSSMEHTGRIISINNSSDCHYVYHDGVSIHHRRGTHQILKRAI